MDFKQEFEKILPKYREISGETAKILESYSKELRDSEQTKFFRALKKIRDEEYVPLYQSGNVHVHYSFENFLRDSYGVELLYDENGMTKPECNVLDKRLYTIFCLKHGV